MGKKRVFLNGLGKREVKPMYHFGFEDDSVGSFVVDFYMDEGNRDGCYMEIGTRSGIFGMRLQGYTYGYLMASARQGLMENIHGFCAMVFLVADGVYQDERFADDVMGAIGGYCERLMERAGQEASGVTEADERGSQLVMEDVARYADSGSDKKRRAMRESWKNDLREGIAEYGESTDDIQGY